MLHLFDLSEAKRHVISGVGYIWASANMASFGVSLVTLLPPLLLGVGSIIAGASSWQRNKIDRDRLAFERERYGDERRDRLQAPPVVASPAATGPVAGPPR